MQITLNDAESKEYLRLKAIFNADAELISINRQLNYFYNIYLVPVHEREDLEQYPKAPKTSVEDLRRLMKDHVESLLDVVTELRAKLKLPQNNNKE